MHQGLSFSYFVGSRNLIVKNLSKMRILHSDFLIYNTQPVFSKCDGKIIYIIIRSKFFFLFIGREPTTWPANNCLQIMVCSCAMPSNSVWLQIKFCACVKETVLFSFLRSLLRENGRSLRFPRIFIKKQTRWSNDKTIIELGYSKISWFVSVSQINYSPKPNNWSARHRQITIFCSTSSNNC